MREKTPSPLTRRLPGSYTVEAAFIFSIVLFTVFILLSEAFALCTETEGKLTTHWEAEYERHLISNKEEKEISRSAEGRGWSISVTLPVFRPEDSLRRWSLFEGEKTL